MTCTPVTPDGPQSTNSIVSSRLLVVKPRNHPRWEMVAAYLTVGYRWGCILNVREHLLLMRFLSFTQELKADGIEGSYEDVCQSYLHDHYPIGICRTTFWKAVRGLKAQGLLLTRRIARGTVFVIDFDRLFTAEHVPGFHRQVTSMEAIVRYAKTGERS